MRTADPMELAFRHARRIEWRDVTDMPATPAESTLCATTRWESADDFDARDRTMKRGATTPLAHRIAGREPLPRCEGLRWIGEGEAAYVVVIHADPT